MIKPEIASQILANIREIKPRPGDKVAAGELLVLYVCVGEFSFNLVSIVRKFCLVIEFGLRAGNPPESTLKIPVPNWVEGCGLVASGRSIRWTFNNGFAYN